MKFTKSQLNAISRSYTLQNQKRAQKEFDEFKQTADYELYKKSNYKTLSGYKNFMVRVKDFEERKNIAEKQAQKRAEKERKAEEIRLAEENRIKEERAERLRNAVKANELTDLNADEVVNFLENYKESPSILQFRKTRNLSFKDLRQLLLGM